MRNKTLAIHPKPASTLTDGELEDIWAFYSRFVQRPKEPFLAAVQATDEVFIGRENSRAPVKAFAAAKVLDVESGGRTYGILYNAWSAVDPAFRGGNLIQRAGLRTFLSYRLRHPFRPVYFAMMSSTYKSYLLMTRNFAECWPHRREPMRDRERDILERAFSAMAGSDWDATAGVVRRHGMVRYTEGVVADDGDQGDPDVAFYARMNPGQPEGDSLACIAPLSLRNWGFMALKALRRRGSKRGR